MNRSISNSIYRIVSIFIMIPVLLFSIIISYFYTSKLETVIADSLHAVATSQLAEMNEFCQRQEKNLSIIGGMDVSRAAFRGELDDETTSFLDNMLYSRVLMIDYLKSITLIDRNNRIVACSEDLYKPYAGEGIEELYKTMKGEPFCITDVLTSERDGKESKTVVAVLEIEEESEILGYALAEINLDFYDNIRERARLWRGSTFYLLDGQGKIISAGTPEESLRMFVTSEEERKDYAKNYEAIDFEAVPQGSFRYKIRGRNYITYYSNVEYTDWRVLLTVDMDNYLEQRAPYAVIVCILAVLWAVMAVYIGKFTSKRIVRPVKRVTEILGDIQRKQDYSLRVEVEHQDELGVLSTNINQLLDFIETENLYQVKRQRLLQEKAERDALTKVLNKEKIMQHLEKTLERCRSSKGKLAVLFVDIDDFKSFNTNYGHGIGDQALLFTAALLEREIGGTTGRVGGDEFLVIVESPERLEVLENSLTRVNQVADSQFTLRGSGEHLPVACCIGAVIVDFSIPGVSQYTAEELVARADAAMYEVKNNGKCGYMIADMECLSEKEKTEK